MKAALNIIFDLRLAVNVALGPTLLVLLSNPRLIFSPRIISRIFMAHVWNAFSVAIDERGSEAKSLLITPYAKGIILDIGAGHGHSIQYLNHSLIQRYIAIEPNILMHPHIRNAAHAAGYTEHNGTLLILPCGLQDSELILAAAGTQVDTIISVLTLCSVPAPEKLIPAMTDLLLKPGGQLLYYEHVLNPRHDIAWWQKLWSPIWSLAFDGCRMDRQTDLWIEQTKGLRRRHVWAKPGEPPESLFFHRLGRYEKLGIIN
ncbi:hypothetical protein F5887DRAFT_109081 [Amanita rubescens]|nr:hypothetical protein F5887DRAFT_109081 [Amanita rubescens]